MKKLVGWKIWYADGLVLDSSFNVWKNCEQKGVQVVKLFYETENGIYVKFHHHQENYNLDDLLIVPPEIKLGKEIIRTDFEDILKLAIKDKTEITSMRDY